MGALGDAQQAARRFLDTTVAPEGSGREAVLFDASERCGCRSWPGISSTCFCTCGHLRALTQGLCSRRDEAGTLYYTLEFTVQSPSFFRHNLSVYAARCARMRCLARLPECRYRGTGASTGPAAPSR